MVNLDLGGVIFSLILVLLGLIFVIYRNPIVAVFTSNQRRAINKNLLYLAYIMSIVMVIVPVIIVLSYLLGQYNTTSNLELALLENYILIPMVFFIVCLAVFSCSLFRALYNFEEKRRITIGAEDRKFIRNFKLLLLFLFAIVCIYMDQGIIIASKDKPIIILLIFFFGEFVAFVGAVYILFFMLKPKNENRNSTEGESK